jgi:hypothetical protein
MLNNQVSKNKYLLAIVAAFMLQLWFDISAYAANNKIYALGLLINLTYPFIAMFPMVLIADEKNTSNRIKIAFMEGIGYVIASALFFYIRDN